MKIWGGRYEDLGRNVVEKYSFMHNPLRNFQYTVYNTPSVQYTMLLPSHTPKSEKNKMTYNPTNLLFKRRKEWAKL